MWISQSSETYDHSLRKHQDFRLVVTCEGKRLPQRNVQDSCNGFRGKTTVLKKPHIIIIKYHKISHAFQGVYIYIIFFLVISIDLSGFSISAQIYSTLEHWLAAWSTVASHSSLGKERLEQLWTTTFQQKIVATCSNRQKVEFFSTWMLSTNPANSLTLNPPTISWPLPSIIALFIPLFQGSYRLLEPARTSLWSWLASIQSQVNHWKVMSLLYLRQQICSRRLPANPSWPLRLQTWHRWCSSWGSRTLQVLSGLAILEGQGSCRFWPHPAKSQTQPYSQF